MQRGKKAAIASALQLERRLTSRQSFGVVFDQLCTAHGKDGWIYKYIKIN